jgi:hypothetical protein
LWVFAYLALALKEKTELVSQCYRPHISVFDKNFLSGQLNSLKFPECSISNFWFLLKIYFTLSSLEKRYRTEDLCLLSQLVLSSDQVPLPLLSSSS